MAGDNKNLNLVWISPIKIIKNFTIKENHLSYIFFIAEYFLLRFYNYFLC